MAMTLSVVEEANTFLVGNNRACSYRRSRKNKCGSGERIRTRDSDCYELKPLGLDNRTTLVLSNTRELNRELFYKLVYLI